MIDNSRPYTIERVSDETWMIDGHLVTDMIEARALCEELDSNRGFDWDFDTYGQWCDGMSCIAVGQSQTITYPEDDE